MGENSHVSAIEAIEKAMEGVTPEAWELIVCDDQRPAVVSSGDVICLPDPNHGRDAGLPDKMDMANFAYISACNPVAMREVLAAAREAEALKREIAELREALRPFAAVEPVSISTSDGHISSNAFRRARALLGGENAE